MFQLNQFTTVVCGKTEQTRRQRLCAKACFEEEATVNSMKNHLTNLHIFSSSFLFTHRVGVFFFLVMNMIFGNLSAVELFIKERPIFMLVTIFSFLLACVASVSSGREANSFFRPRENRANAKIFFFFFVRLNVARPEKEFASRPLETLATQATFLFFSPLISFSDNRSVLSAYFLPLRATKVSF